MAVCDSEIAHYLATGDSDALGRDGETWEEGLRSYDRALRNALLAEVKLRELDHQPSSVRLGFNLATSVRDKVGPMICGLFPKSERETVLRAAESSVVFLTQEAAYRIILETGFRSSAWMIANIYLGSLGLKGLDGKVAPLGCNEHTTCFVSLEYFRDSDPFADYVVHEVAHMFHNCKRNTLGLRSTRRREWLLEIAFQKRELFAYACEFYSRILVKGQSASERRFLLAEFAKSLGDGDFGLNREELLEILGEAITARNGWKRILASCSPRQPG